MDNNQFDRLAKAAHGGTRRQLMRGMVGGLLATVAAGLGARRATAQTDVYLGLGAPCYTDWQCDQSEQAVYCADNQFDFDGGYNCCLGQFGFRGYSEYGTSFCRGSMTCQEGICNYPGAAEIVQGDPCEQDAQCPRSAGPPLICEVVRTSYDRTRRCCRVRGGSCSSDEGCCRRRSCVNGYCQ